MLDLYLADTWQCIGQADLVKLIVLGLLFWNRKVILELMRQATTVFWWVVTRFDDDRAVRLADRRERENADP